MNPNINPAMQLKPLVTSRVAKVLIEEKKFKVVQRHIVDKFVSNNMVSTVDDEFNNIFMDLELLQRRMVEYYDISFEESGGILQFVIKMDECEFLKEKKMERVTITLMNRALANVSREDKC